MATAGVAQTCGDINNDGSLNATETNIWIQYFHLGGAAPPNMLAAAAVDGAPGATIRDAQFSLGVIFGGNGPAGCPCDELTPYTVNSDPGVDISIDSDTYPAGASSHTINVTLSSNVNVIGHIFPLMIRVDGAVPTIVSVNTDFGNWDGLIPVTSRVIADSGVVVFGANNISGIGTGSAQIAQIQIAAPMSGLPRAITYSWVAVSAEQAPAPDCAIRPMVLQSDANRSVWEPYLNGAQAPVVCIEDTTGATPPPPDTDGDGVADVCDNCPAIPNPNQADWDDNGVGDICDVSDFDGDGALDFED
ncbi:MAG TPA: thrombospondin type 3 repeat-containing protein, partial [candidate division Zixibacteria bacterium]|nr:thrombospondin type 3 repeat-containing protein [candidate division Zixibacteria bacterium]